MKKAKQWGKPEVGVLAFSKPSNNAGSFHNVGPEYLGPAPFKSLDVPYSLGPSVKGYARSYIGPNPVPPMAPREEQYFLGPAVSQLGPHTT